MTIYRIPIVRDGILYRFEPYLGLLLARVVEETQLGKRRLPLRIQQGLQMNDHPYQLEMPVNHYGADIRPHLLLKLFAHILVRVCRASFGLARFAAFFRFHVFSSATDATLFFRRLFPGAVQQSLCFPRSLFAAATSKKFRTSGILFIGVFLPSKSMHAWIIEDGIQPDPYDGMWVNFQPVAVLYMGA